MWEAADLDANQEEATGEMRETISLIAKDEADEGYSVVFFTQFVPLLTVLGQIGALFIALDAYARVTDRKDMNSSCALLTFVAIPFYQPILIPIAKLIISGVRQLMATDPTPEMLAFNIAMHKETGKGKSSIGDHFKEWFCMAQNSDWRPRFGDEVLLTEGPIHDMRNELALKLGLPAHKQSGCCCNKAAKDGHTQQSLPGPCSKIMLRARLMPYADGSMVKRCKDEHTTLSTAGSWRRMFTKAISEFHVSHDPENPRPDLLKSTQDIYRVRFNDPWDEDQHMQVSICR
jgi:hypothetical protein